MATAVVSHRFVFGVKSGVAGNVNFLDEQTVIYPAGSNCILYHLDQKSQRFILGSDKSQGMSAIAVSPNRRYIAIAERSDKPIITIYDLHTLKRRKVLNAADYGFTEFVSLAFSPDSKYLASQGGKPDWTLLYWTWEKSKVMATTKTTNQHGAPVYQVSNTTTVTTFIFIFIVNFLASLLLIKQSINVGLIRMILNLLR